MKLNEMDCGGIAGIGGDQVPKDQRDPGVNIKKRKRLRDIIKVKNNANRRIISIKN